MKIPSEKFIALDEEVRTAINLIISGFNELQKINLGNDFYYLPFLLLSNGFEKLLKTIICFAYWEKNNEFPTLNNFKESPKDNGHNLVFLKSYILSNIFVANTPALEKDRDELINNVTLNKLIEYLSEFGQYSRYHNLNVIISNNKQRSKDIKQLWEQLETDLLLNDTELFERLKNNLTDINNLNINDISDINKKVQVKIIILLEFFTRALVRQFTFGILGEAKRLTGTIGFFLHMVDGNLGKNNYSKIKKL